MYPHQADTLRQLRRSVAQIDAGQHALGAAPPLALGVAAVDAVLGGGLACGALHEFAPALPIDSGAATGFALALAARALCFEHDLVRKPVSTFRDHARGHVFWIQSDFGKIENGAPYGPGLAPFGLALDRLVILTVTHAVDMLWAMEEALRSRAVKLVIGEMPDERATDDGMAARRLSLAARDTGSLGLLLRPRPALAPSAAATRWQIAAAPSAPDEFGGAHVPEKACPGLVPGWQPVFRQGHAQSKRPGPHSVSTECGLGRTTFALSLTKNRRGPCGRWLIAWNHHERAFHPALSVGVAAAAGDRPGRTPLAHTG